MSKTIYVWECEDHGEFELMEKQEKAFCPRCGKEMKKVDEYTEGS